MTDHPPAIPASTATDRPSLLFVVRLWWEPAGGDATGEWRGWVEHAATRERRYFRDDVALVGFIGRHVGWSTRAAPPAIDQPATVHPLPERSAAMPSTNGYAHPEVLVETQWVADHLDDSTIRLVEVDVDTAAYETGHLPGAVGWNWRQDTQQPIRRDIPDKASLADLLSRSGIGNDTTVILYGDNNNWFATYAYWLLKMHGHADARIMNGGRKKWVDEGRALTTDLPSPARTAYRAADPNREIRAARGLVEASLGLAGRGLVDVRSPKEYSGELLAPENLPQEGAQRGGHIPGATSIPWLQAVQEDGSFKPAATLRALYEGHGITPDKEIIAYCRIGERSSHTWFVLHELLGYPNVRNYDGSWTEWGSLIGAPIEKG